MVVHREPATPGGTKVKNPAGPVDESHSGPTPLAAPDLEGLEPGQLAIPIVGGKGLDGLRLRKPPQVFGAQVRVLDPTGQSDPLSGYGRGRMLVAPPGRIGAGTEAATPRSADMLRARRSRPTNPPLGDQEVDTEPHPEGKTKDLHHGSPCDGLRKADHRPYRRHAQCNGEHADHPLPVLLDSSLANPEHSHPEGRQEHQAECQCGQLGRRSSESREDGGRHQGEKATHCPGQHQEPAAAPVEREVTSPDAGNELEGRQHQEDEPRNDVAQTDDRMGCVPRGKGVKLLSRRERVHQATGAEREEGKDRKDHPDPTGYLITSHSGVPLAAHLDPPNRARIRNRFSRRSPGYP